MSITPEKWEKLWHIHYFREFGHWAKLKFDKTIKVVKCDLCGRYAESDPDRFNLEYCRRMKIPFKCGSCLFPQYRTTLRNPTRGNVGRIYG